MEVPSPRGTSRSWGRETPSPGCRSRLRGKGTCRAFRERPEGTACAPRRGHTFQGEGPARVTRGMTGRTWMCGTGTGERGRGACRPGSRGVPLFRKGDGDGPVQDGSPAEGAIARFTAGSGSASAIPGLDGASRPSWRSAGPAVRGLARDGRRGFYTFDTGPQWQDACAGASQKVVFLQNRPVALLLAVSRRHEAFGIHQHSLRAFPDQTVGRGASVERAMCRGTGDGDRPEGSRMAPQSHGSWFRAFSRRRHAESAMPPSWPAKGFYGWPAGHPSFLGVVAGGSGQVQDCQSGGQCWCVCTLQCKMSTQKYHGNPFRMHYDSCKLFQYLHISIKNILLLQHIFCF
jgi:hypothetical protein